MEPKAKAPKCQLVSCNRATWDGFCYQHRDRRDLSLGLGLPIGRPPAHQASISGERMTSSIDEAQGIIDMIGGEYGVAPRKWDEVAQLIVSRFDKATRGLARDLFPKYEDALAGEGQVRSTAYDPFRERVSRDVAISEVNMTPEDFAYFLVETAPRNTGEPRRWEDEARIGSYTLRMAWEIDSYRRDAGEAGIPASTYGEVINGWALLVRQRELALAGRLLDEWDEVIKEGTGSPSRTVKDQDVRVHDQGRALSRFAPQPAAPDPAPLAQTATSDPSVYAVSPVHGPTAQPGPKKRTFSAILSEIAEALKPSEADIAAREARAARRKREAEARERARAEDLQAERDYARSKGMTLEEFREEKARKKTLEEARIREARARESYANTGADRNAAHLRDRRWRRFFG